jgi:hypothetical protein
MRLLSQRVANREPWTKVTTFLPIQLAKIDTIIVEMPDE